MFPFHYLVTFCWWINYYWNSYRHKPTWIDKKLKNERRIYLKFKEPPRTGWDLKVTPDFIINNIKPVNWFHRKMQELFFGFKWAKQKA